jgi:hypothetical protein
MIEVRHEPNFCVIAFCLSGIDGPAALNNHADRINKWGLWAFSPGYTSYYQAMVIDISKAGNEVSSRMTVYWFTFRRLS